MSSISQVVSSLDEGHFLVTILFSGPSSCILQARRKDSLFLTKEVCIKTRSTATSDHIHSKAWLVPRESNYFTFCGGRELKTTSFVFFYWHGWPNFDTVFSEFNSREKYEHLTNWTRWNKREKVWSSANSLFSWRFRSRQSRHRRCCLQAPWNVCPHVIL